MYPYLEKQITVFVSYCPPALPIDASQGSAGKFRLICGLLEAYVGYSAWSLTLCWSSFVFELREFWKTEHRHCSQQLELQDIKFWDTELPLTGICWELSDDFLLSEILHIKRLYFLENTLVMHQNHSFLYSISKQCAKPCLVGFFIC